jgi:hypothetical protein
MGQLTKYMYRQGSHLFGLSDGQMRRGDSKITHNSGWYNKAGEILGWGGDLSAGDMKRIQEGLELNELFIILSNQDARYARSGKPDLDAPGITYVAGHCRYIIDRERIYVIQQFKESSWTIDGITPEIISRTKAKKIIKDAQKTE